jgi:hypothetical protein|nr:MAG TPA: hypothetical protein [Caudoviricetes sp.]
MKFLPKKKLALTMEIFGERAFAGITLTGIEHMVEKLLLSDIFRNAHYLIVGSKGIM